MSLRERFAWVAFLGIIISIGLYVLALILAARGVIPGHYLFATVLGLIAALIVLPLVIRALLAIRMPKGSLTEQDERERLFELKATRIAFFVLAFGVGFLTFLTAHGTRNPRDIVHGVLAAIVLSYLVKFGTEIRYHRRGY